MSAEERNGGGSCQSVYLVLAPPRDAGDVQLSIELVATLETRFGPIRVGLPNEAQRRSCGRYRPDGQRPTTDDRQPTIVQCDASSCNAHVGAKQLPDGEEGIT